MLWPDGQRVKTLSPTTVSNLENLKSPFDRGNVALAVWGAAPDNYGHLQLGPIPTLTPR